MGETATFMPKPMFGDNRLRYALPHVLCLKTALSLFAGDKYAGLSEQALYYIGGVIKHAKAINALANQAPTLISVWSRAMTPVMLAYSARNRSASIRIPVVSFLEAVVWKYVPGPGG
ncbi:hypothetical protein ACNKHV_24625 [Shigella flexneri]